MHASTDEETIEQIAADFPGWHVWRSRDTDDRPGKLMATRRSDLTAKELEAGLACTLPIGYGGDLREQLAAQVKRERSIGWSQ